MASAAKTVIEANLTGRVKWFDLDKGYGFIKRDGNGADLFVHSSEVEIGYLDAEEEVRFDVGKGRKGPEAINVKSVNEDPARSARGLRSVFRQLARLQTLFDRDEDDYGSDDTFDYYMNYEDADSDDLEDFLRHYEDDDDDDLDTDDDDDDDFYDGIFDSTDEEEAVERPDKFMGVSQLFQDPKEALAAAAKVPFKIKPPVEAEIVCSLCDEQAVPVTFHPCQHQVCCLDCSIRLRKCPSCKVSITKKEQWDGQEVELKNAAKYTELLEILQAQEETKMCTICLDKKKNTVFGCGHFACQDCAKILNSCHICRKKIHVRTKVFEI